ncbi:MAG: AGE family epimerase/isomerase [Balneolales bacterium]
MNNRAITKIRHALEYELYENIIPFWEVNSPDWENGGYFNCLDRSGKVYDSNKFVWLQARQAWMFSKLFNEVEDNPNWYKIAELGVNFLKKKAIKKDGRVYFSLNKHGHPLWLQRKIFSECFYIIALAEFSKTGNHPKLLNEAKIEFERVWQWSKDLSKVGRPAFKGDTGMQTLAIPMILLNVIEELSPENSTEYSAEVNACIQQIILHINYDKKVVLENVAKDGSFINSIEGRLLNPGHAIEAGWFLHHWAQRLNDMNLQDQAVNIIHWSFSKGWDQEYGGLYYFLDSEGHSPTQLEWFMKLWWPHTEAMYSFLINFSITGSDKDWKIFNQIREYTFNHFADDGYKEWFGYLNREGKPTHTFKGGPYKGCFHVPRSLWLCCKLLQKLEDKS